jgi:hypothetical protein
MMMTKPLAEAFGAAGPAPGPAPGLGPPPDPTPVTFVQYVGDACLHWSVVEVDAGAVPGARGARCLLFSRPECIRRVWSYPADWRALDDAGLAALGWRR